MFDAEKYIIIAAISYLIAFQLTAFLIPLLSKIGFIDELSARRIHTIPTPRGGGIAVAVSLSISLAIVYFFPLWPELVGTLDVQWWLNTLPATALLLIIGLFDDHKGLNWKLKLLGQATAAFLLFASGISLRTVAGIELPMALDLALTVIWILAFVNAFNLIDGLDGLASGLAMIAALGLSLSSAFRSQPLDALVLVVMVGACAGFLRHNFHPAKIFLGDTGSMFIGFTLAAISLQTSTKATVITAIGMPLLAIGIPVLDTLLAIWRRSVRAANRDDINIAKADLDHLHHRLLARGLTQRRTALLLYSLNFFLVAVGLASVAFSSQALSILLVAFVLGSYVIFKHLAHIELWDSSQLALRGLTRPSRSALASLAYPVLDVILLSAVWLAATAVTNSNHLNATSWKEAFRSLAPLWLGSVFCFLVISKTYSRVWSRAGISELTGTAFWLSFGSVVAFALTRLTFPERNLLTEVNFFVVFSTLAMIVICGIRALPRTVDDWARMSAGDISSKAPRALIYGAGLQGLLLLRSLGTARCPILITPVGFIDDDSNLRKRVVHGLEVMGNGLELLKLAKQEKVKLVILATNLDESVEMHLSEEARKLDIALFKWSTSLLALKAPVVSASTLKTGT